MTYMGNRNQMWMIVHDKKRKRVNKRQVLIKESQGKLAQERNEKSFYHSRIYLLGSEIF